MVDGTLRVAQQNGVLMLIKQEHGQRDKPCALSCAEGKAVRTVQYVTPIKRQIIGPDKAACIERYESSGPPDSGFLVNVHVQTPKVCLPCVASVAYDKRWPHGMSCAGPLWLDTEV